MKAVERTLRFLKRRKLLLALPLFIIPLLTVGFWALSKEKDAQKDKVRDQGLNTQLPEAQLESKEESKWRLYEKEEQDSLHLKRKGNRDVYFDLSAPVFKDSLARSY